MRKAMLVRALVVLLLGVTASVTRPQAAEAFAWCFACGYHSTCDAYEGQQACDRDCLGLNASGCWQSDSYCGWEAKYLCGTFPW